jgi:hypothetical protein
MSWTSEKERRFLEIMLIATCLGLTCLLYVMEGYKVVIFNLFFLPVILGAFILGRYQGGVLALFCVISASVVSVLRLPDFCIHASPSIVALGIVVWAAVLGLSGMLVGTLADDRATKIKELHEAYVGVVEVLSQYLQSANPSLKAQAVRVAELSQRVAKAMKLSPREIDDVRVAALLYDLGNIEVTTRVIRRAVGAFEENGSDKPRHTFQGMDLMLSLGSVLSGAIPLLLKQGQDVLESTPQEIPQTASDLPLGARIIHAVRAYCALAPDTGSRSELPAEDLFRRLRRDRAAGYDPEVLAVLEHVVSRAAVARSEPVPEPVAL